MLFLARRFRVPAFILPPLHGHMVHRRIHAARAWQERQTKRRAAAWTGQCQIWQVDIGLRLPDRRHELAVFAGHGMTIDLAAQLFYEHSHSPSFPTLLLSARSVPRRAKLRDQCLAFLGTWRLISRGFLLTSRNFPLSRRQTYSASQIHRLARLSLISGAH